MSIGIWQLVLVLVIVLLLFGTGKLARAMGDLARGVRTFRDDMKDTPQAAGTDVPASEAASGSPPKALPAPEAAAPRREPATVGANEPAARS